MSCFIGILDDRPQDAGTMLGMLSIRARELDEERRFLDVPITTGIPEAWIQKARKRIAEIDAEFTSLEDQFHSMLQRRAAA